MTDHLPSYRRSLTVERALKSLAGLLLVSPPRAPPCPCPCPSPGHRGGTRFLDPKRIERTRLIRSEFNNETVRQDTPDSLPGRSFYTTNEVRHYIWHDRVQDLGGILVGISTYQSFILAGWARPERIILMDFDINIVRLHKAYRVCFEIAKTPQEFIRLWSEDNIQKLKDCVSDVYSNETDYNYISGIVHNERRSLFQHLQNVQSVHRAINVSTFLTNQTQYDFVANLSRMGYVTPLCGDVFGNKTLRDIASVAAKTSLPIRLLYLSNLEDHFAYNEQFRVNIGNLPFDSDSLVLRTCFVEVWKLKFNKTHDRIGTHFCTQRASDFVAWLDQPKTRHVSDIFASERMSKVSIRRSEERVVDELNQSFVVGRDQEYTCFVLSSPVEHVLGHPSEICRDARIKI